MSSDGDQLRLGKPDRDLTLSGILKALRAHCGMTAAQVAEGMAMDLRAYQRFEAGEGYLRVERIFRFAAVTNTDPYALLASFRLGAPELALACADNKFVMLLIAHLRELYGEKGADIRRLQPQVIIEVLSAAFSALGDEVEAARALSEKWLGKSGRGDPPEESD